MERRRSIISPILFGRDQELTDLSDHLSTSLSGRGQTVVLAGEAGIGKSRLVAEIAERAAAAGAFVLNGRCFEPHRAIPFAPLRGLIARFAESQSEPELERRFGSSAGGYLALAPELTSVLKTKSPPAMSEIELDRHYFLNLLGQFVLGCAHDQPTLVVIEDLHWSDDASLSFVLHVTRELANSPILLLLTYRLDEANPDLDHTIAELQRGRSASLIQLDGLQTREIARMIQAIFGLERPVHPAFVHAVEELTGGNPFFVEEVLAALLASGDIFLSGNEWERKPFDQLQIPATISDAVARRLPRISPAALRCLEFASIAGQQFEFPLLLVLGEYHERELLLLIKELISEQFIVEESADRFAFRHALTRQAVETRLLAREKQTLHRRVANALSQLYGDRQDEVVGRLAYHSFHAGEWADAMRYGERAGEQALAHFAPLAAIEQFDRVLSAATKSGTAPSLTTHRNRGLAHETVGNFGSARADFETVLSRAQLVVDHKSTWQALLDLGFLWTAIDVQRALGYLDQALTTARTLGDPEHLAHSLNRMGNWFTNQDRVETAIAYHLEALAIFESLADLRGVADTLDLLGMAHSVGGNMQASVGACQRAAALFREQGNLRSLAGVLILASSAPNAVYELSTAVGLGTLEDATRDGEESIAICRQIGWKTGESYSLAIVGECRGGAGEIETARTLLAEALDVAESLHHAEWTIQALWGIGELFADCHALSEAADALARALAIAEQMQSPLWSNFIAGSLASVMIRLTRTDQARALLTRFLADSHPMSTMAQRRLWSALAEFHLAEGHPRDALDIVDRLYATAHNLEDEGQIPWLAERKAIALLALDQKAEAEGLLARAIATTEHSGARIQEIRLRLLLIKLFESDDRPSQVAAEKDAVRSILEHLANTTAQGSLRDKFILATNQAIGDSTPTDHRGQVSPEQLLTRREREVAILVAGGQSNRDIGSALFVSERTVEAHVSNIMHKLGFNARTQIASWATEHGLSRNAN